jgi:hypothetical protein
VDGTCSTHVEDERFIENSRNTGTEGNIWEFKAWIGEQR